MKFSLSSALPYAIPLVIVAGVIGLILFSSSSDSSNVGGSPARATRELVLSCTTDMATRYHIHPMLGITINGQRQVIPTNIGIDEGSCMNPVHTHDTTGKIHVESPVEKVFLLSDVFLVWGKTFNKDQILDSNVDATHRIRMTVNGVESTEFENLVLEDLDKIEIYYEAISPSEAS